MHVFAGGVCLFADPRFIYEKSDYKYKDSCQYGIEIKQPGTRAYGITSYFKSESDRDWVMEQIADHLNAKRR